MATGDLADADLLDVLRTRHVATDLTRAFTVFQDDPGRQARRQRFDQAPVVVSETRVVGWVAASELRDDRVVRSVMTPLDRSAIVSTESCIADLLRLLGQHGLVFTVGNDGLSGFVVHSDLDRHAARSHFYLVIAGIEMLLSAVIRSVTPIGSIIAAMNSDMAKQYDKAKAASSETHPVEYLYLTALVRLVLDTAYAKDGTLWDESSTRWLTELNKFRKLVMHPARSIAAAKSRTEIAAFADDAQEVTERLQEIVEKLGMHGEASGYRFDQGIIVPSAPPLRQRRGRTTD